MKGVVETRRPQVEWGFFIFLLSPEAFELYENQVHQEVKLWLVSKSAFFLL